MVSGCYRDKDFVVVVTYDKTTIVGNETGTLEDKWGNLDNAQEFFGEWLVVTKANTILF